MVNIAANIQAVRARIAQAETTAQRAPGSVKLMLAAKYQPLENLLEAMEAGERLFGHNIVQQLEAAEIGLAHEQFTDLHHTTTMIGHVQSNKLSTAMKYAQRIDTVDSLKTAQQIDRRQAARINGGEVPQGEPYPILLQMNSSGAPTQYGCEPAQLLTLAAQILELPNVRIDGLMTIGANEPDNPSAIAYSFDMVRTLSGQLREMPTLAHASVLSMGMTHDLELAIEHGSTEVRIGTAIFGPRPAN